MNVNFKNLVQISVLAVAAISLSACGQAQIPTNVNSVYRQMQTQTRNQVEQQILVRFRPDASRTEMQAFNQRHNLHTDNYITGINVYVMSFRNQVQSRAEMQTVLATISRDRAVAFVEVNQNVQVAPVPYDLHTLPVLK